MQKRERDSEREKERERERESVKVKDEVKERCWKDCRGRRTANARERLKQPHQQLLAVYIHV